VIDCVQDGALALSIITNYQHALFAAAFQLNAKFEAGASGEVKEAKEGKRSDGADGSSGNEAGWQSPVTELVWQHTQRVLALAASALQAATAQAGDSSAGLTSGGIAAQLQQHPVGALLRPLVFALCAALDTNTRAYADQSAFVGRALPLLGDLSRQMQALERALVARPKTAEPARKEAKAPAKKPESTPDESGKKGKGKGKRKSKGKRTEQKGKPAPPQKEDKDKKPTSDAEDSGSEKGSSAGSDKDDDDDAGSDGDKSGKDDDADDGSDKGSTKGDGDSSARKEKSGDESDADSDSESEGDDSGSDDDNDPRTAKHKVRSVLHPCQVLIARCFGAHISLVLVSSCPAHLQSPLRRIKFDKIVESLRKHAEEAAKAAKKDKEKDKDKDKKDKDKDEDAGKLADSAVSAIESLISEWTSMSDRYSSLDHSIHARFAFSCLI
jgi:hypothetical protein